MGSKPIFGTKKEERRELSPKVCGLCGNVFTPVRFFAGKGRSVCEKCKPKFKRNNLMRSSCPGETVGLYIKLSPACELCGDKVETHVYHVIPLSVCGGESFANFITLCPKCQSLKRNHVFEFETFELVKQFSKHYFKTKGEQR